MAVRAQYPDEQGEQGSFKRQVSAFRDWVRKDASTEFLPEANRYHLYVSFACPWAHRTIIYRTLKGLEDVIGMTVVDPIRDERSWVFRDGPGHSQDPLNGFTFLSEAYMATDPSFAGRVTVPVLWDKKTNRIVNNESAEIIRMLDREFDEFANNKTHFCSDELRERIDEVNDFVYRTINNGVYLAGFATQQKTYERAVGVLFDALDELEGRLANQRYLVGNQITEADWRLFTTLVRFDAVYVGHFKCNIRRIADYPNLFGYLRNLYQQEGVAATVNFDHIKRHYYVTHTHINPNGIFPLGPDLDLDTT